MTEASRMVLTCDLADQSAALLGALRRIHRVGDQAVAKQPYLIASPSLDVVVPLTRHG